LDESEYSDDSDFDSDDCDLKSDNKESEAVKFDEDDDKDQETGSFSNQETGSFSNADFELPDLPEELTKDEYLAFIKVSLGMADALVKNGISMFVGRKVKAVLSKRDKRDEQSEKLYSLISPEVYPRINQLHRLDVCESAFSMKDANVRPVDKKVSTYRTLLSGRRNDDPNNDRSPAVSDLNGLIYIGTALGKQGLKQRFSAHSSEHHYTHRRTP